MTTLFLVTNSPGEVSTFVRPVVENLARFFPELKIQVCLVPCPYATGAEAQVIRRWPQCPEVWSPWETTRHFLQGNKPIKKGVVVFLGGDPWHALLLKRRFAMPALAYFAEASSWQKSNFLGGFDQVLLGYRPLQGEVGLWIGDLRVDAVQSALGSCDANSSDSEKVLGLFPGSRWMHLQAVLGPYLKAVDRLGGRGYRFIMAVSPFVSREQLAKAAGQGWNLGLARSRAEIQGDSLLTEAGNRVELSWGDPYSVIKSCQVALCLPGTNTAELAIAGKPVVVPLSYRVPVGGGGLFGLLDRLPGLSSWQRKWRSQKKRRVKFLALPNRLAGREVVPEFFVDDDLENLVDLLRDLLDDSVRCRAIGQDAQQVMGPSGAALHLINESLKLITLV